MKVWRCASVRPDGGSCWRRVGNRPRWRADQRRWIGGICDRCWQEQLDSHPARVVEIAGDPNVPDGVLRALSRVGDPRLDEVVAARGDRLPAELRTIFEQSDHENVRRAAEVGDRVPLEPAWWLYRRTPTPATYRWAAVAGVATVVIVIGALIAVNRADDAKPDSAISTPPDTTTAPVSTAAAVDTGTTTANPAATGVGGDDAPVVQFTQFDVPGEPGASCIVFVTVTEVSTYRLYSPDEQIYDSDGFSAVTGPPGTWEISYIAPPSVDLNPQIEIDNCP